jgi:hypothetical protein
MNYQDKDQLAQLAKKILEPKIYQSWFMHQIQGLSFPQMEYETKTPKMALYLRFKKAESELIPWKNDPNRTTTLTLSAKAQNALRNYGIKNKKQALKSYQDGDLHPSRMRNYGWKTHNEVCEWLEVPVIKENPEKKEFECIDRILSRLNRRIQIEDDDLRCETKDEISTLERWKRIMKSKYAR